jgi:hypothetical protein
MNGDLATLFDDAVGIFNELPDQLERRIRSIGELLQRRSQWRYQRSRDRFGRTISRCAIPRDVNMEEW